MALHSHTSPDGVPTFELKKPAIQRSLFDRESGYSEPPRELADVLLKVFAGKDVTISEIVRQHSRGTRFVERNYREALLLLEAEGRISAEPRADARPSRNGRPTWGDRVRAGFPPE